MQGPGFTVAGLTVGATYTGVIPVWSEQNAPAVAAVIDGTTAGPWVVAKGSSVARVVFIATATEHTLTLEPEPLVAGQVYGDTWAAGYMLTEGNYQGAYFPDRLYEQAPVVVLDHEAMQGSTVDYIVADGNGAQLASTRVTVPKWGTWLKSPGRPYRNSRCYLEHAGPVARAANRQVVPIAGQLAGQAPPPVVLSQARAAKTGQVRLVALAGAQSDAIDRLLLDGGTLLLDTDPEWKVPYRYISVGDTEESRPYGGGTLKLEHPARVHTLNDVIGVAAPTGVTVVDATHTNATVAAAFGSYAAVAAIVPTYEALGTGEYL